MLASSLRMSVCPTAGSRCRTVPVHTPSRHRSAEACDPPVSPYSTRGDRHSSYDNATPSGDSGRSWPRALRASRDDAAPGQKALRLPSSLDDQPEAKSQDLGAGRAGCYACACDLRNSVTSWVTSAGSSNATILSFRKVNTCTQRKSTSLPLPFGPSRLVPSTTTLSPAAKKS
jgi:hypothetical protein